MTKSLALATANAIIAAFLAGRPPRSIAAEHGKTERAVRMIIRRNPYARAELARAVL